MRCLKVYIQRTEPGAVGELAIRQQVNEVDDCNIADVIFIAQIYNVQPELKHKKEMLRQYSLNHNDANLLMLPAGLF